MASVRLKGILDKFVSTPALVRALKPAGTLRIKDAGNQVVEIQYIRHPAFIEFIGADETMKMKIPDRYVKPQK
jgi:hypothetical protein